jgi:hypothetical protein
MVQAVVGATGAFALGVEEGRGESAAAGPCTELTEKTYAFTRRHPREKQR